MKPIAHIHTDLPQKFGIPRNSFLAPHLQGRIVFEPEYALNSAVAGIDSFSHLWLLWRFENGEPGGGAADVAGARATAATGERDAGAPGKANAGTADCTSIKGVACRHSATGKRGNESHAVADVEAPAGTVTGTAGGNASATGAAGRAAASHPKPARWSPTVRPPRLGGAERVGVFATRSPFRPNPIGLTCVKLDRVELTDAGPIIHVLGADLRDGTPIYDIKPYIPFADCHPDACGGWIENAPWHELDVDFPKQLQAEVPASKLPGLTEVLRQDPRRAGSKHEPTRVYHLAYAGLDVAFTVDGDVLHVACVSYQRHPEPTSPASGTSPTHAAASAPP
nr:tRNA (N6-threonylcarbamoyladenosine(37)-N6)-methyltransferase TrmO [uncultured Senegalimassilia sp.]